MDTRDIRMSVEQIKALNTFIMIQPLETLLKFPEVEEILGMMVDAVNHSDSETLNDFTA